MCKATSVTWPHTVKSCPLTKLNGGLSWLHSSDKDAVLWLTSYGSWHTYEKKKWLGPNVPHCWILSLDKTEWQLISATLFGRRRCFVADQLRFMTHIREEVTWSQCPTLLNPVPWQNWMAAYLGYAPRMKMLFRGWPIMVHDTHMRRTDLVSPRNVKKN